MWVAERIGCQPWMHASRKKAIKINRKKNLIAPKLNYSLFPNWDGSEKIAKWKCNDENSSREEIVEGL